ncbi:DUF2634 domain-containing protein [Paenibacillus brevis]|uniref:DUF2634 domain-containing protein n=1 Tax=Paenibacillus brevis TaxID=2841508 RepID=A0ABS6FQH0_9BACL|nr:DUF2634 domain-containing protein [Paenibacillus brevis]MBU5672273.1 DUF2634 domain-containing protein [Paenibacillus brevis]
MNDSRNEGIEAENGSSEILFGRSWRFDFEQGEFILTPTRKIASSSGTDAWVVWCQKAIRTPRYRHLIYSRIYGQELDELIGKGYSRAVLESEIQRMVSEALLLDPRTADVDGFYFSWQGAECSFNCQVTNVHDEVLRLEGSVG